MPNITSIPAPRVDFIDKRTGLMSREWYLFFVNLYNLTGSGSNEINLNDVQIAPQPGFDQFFEEDQESQLSQLPSESVSVDLVTPSPPELGTMSSYNLVGQVTPGSVTYSNGFDFVVVGPGTSGQVLTSGGTGTPTWTTPTTGTVTSVTASAPLVSSGGNTPNISVTPSALTKTDDTNVTLTLGGTPATSLLAGVVLALGWTGTLAVARGGIGTGTAGIGAFNNITGYSASGATGTTSTDIVFSTSPTLTTPKATTTLGVGNATPSASGSGISFPATQSASTDPNTLDDYEEGTWTPTDASGAGLSFTIAGTSTYTKIGNQVIARCGLTYPVTASGAVAQIGGLPFASGAYGAASIQAFFGAKTVASLASGYNGAGATTVILSDAVGGFILNSTMSSGIVYMTVIYQV